MTEGTAAQHIKNQLKPNTFKEKKEELESKQMYGKFYRDLVRPSVDKEKSLAWLCSSGIKGATASSSSTGTATLGGFWLAL